MLLLHCYNEMGTPATLSLSGVSSSLLIQRVHTPLWMIVREYDLWFIISTVWYLNIVVHRAYCLVGFHPFLSWGHTKSKSDFPDDQSGSCQNCRVFVKTKLEFHSCSFSVFQLGLDLASRNPEIQKYELQYLTHKCLAVAHGAPPMTVTCKPQKFIGVHGGQ